MDAIRERLSPTTLAVLAAVALAFVFLVGWFTLVAPKRAEAADLDRQIESMQTLLARPAPPAVEQAEVESQEQLERLSRAVPDEIQMAAVVLELNALASQARVRLDGITPQPAVAGNGYQSQPIAMTLQGSFFGLSDFLRRLRREATLSDGEIRGSGRLYSVDSLSFAEGEAKFPSITAQITISTYFGAAAAAVPESAEAPTATSTPGTEEATP